MAPISQPKAKPVRRKSTRKQKKPVIDSDEEAKRNASIELDHDGDVEEIVSDRNTLSDDEDASDAGFSTPKTSYTTPIFDPQLMQKSSVQLRSQGLKRLADESLTRVQVCSPSRKSIRAHPSEKDACVQIFQELQSLAKTVQDLTSYIKELEKKVEYLTVLVKKGEKPAEVATKKMDTMASRLSALATAKLDNNPKNSHMARLGDKSTGDLEKAVSRKIPARGPHLIIDLEKCEQVQKDLTCQDLRRSLQVSLKAQTFTSDVTLKGLNRDAKRDHRYFVFFESSDDARKARIHDSWVTIQYPHARLFTGTTYPVKVHRVRISAVVDEMTNTVIESTKKKIEEENGGLEITEIRWLSKPDETKRYGSMLLRLADEQTAFSLLEKGLLDVAGESCIVEEWEIQKIAEQRCFKCQKFGHLARSCTSPSICGNCAEKGHSHRECQNPRILCANCQGKHRANDRNCIAKPNAHIHPGTPSDRNIPSQAQLPQSYFTRSLFPLSQMPNPASPMFASPIPPFVVNE